MAKIFFDTNYFIGLTNKSSGIDVKTIDKHEVFISILTCHIFFYVNKITVLDEKINILLEDFNIIEFSQKILNFALLGPTKDLGDNIQLYSASELDCDYFLTKDKDLLKIKYFGKTKIVENLN